MADRANSDEADSDGADFLDGLDIGGELARLRAARPLIHVITSPLAAVRAADAVLALGARPAMVQGAEEAPEFAVCADALSINIGMLDSRRRPVMHAAVAAARGAGRPWCLDPVAVGVGAHRLAAGRELLALRPALLRGNASEILTLAGAGGGARGPDTADTVEAARDAALVLARETGGVVAVTGPVDLVTDGALAVRIANGDPMMPRATALGCALSAVATAFLGAGATPLPAAVAALACFALAGERAAQVCAGPGSLTPALIDALYAMTPETLTAGARLRLESAR